MTRFNIILLYLAISAINGIVPPVFALLFSVPERIALLIWGLATLVSFAIICLICLRSAMKSAIPEIESGNIGREFTEVTI